MSLGHLCLSESRADKLLVQQDPEWGQGLQYVMAVTKLKSQQIPKLKTLEDVLIQPSQLLVQTGAWVLRERR